MHDTNQGEAGSADPLAEIIRAAGRRAPPPPEHYDEVYAAARAAWRRKVSSRRKRRWFALAASMILVGTGALVVALLQTGRPIEAARLAVAQGTTEWFAAQAQAWEAIPDSGIALNAGVRIRTGSNGRLALELSDGGSLRLDVDTEIVLGRTQQTLTAGRLYFDSAGRPAAEDIEVLTPYGVISELGTQFEVQMQRSLLRVRVREGGVALHRTASLSDLEAIAGEEIVLSANGESRTGEIEADDPDWTWAESLASVPESDSRSILLYLRWIARETGKRLQWESPIVEFIAEQATFDGDPAGLGFTPRQLLEHIEQTSDFNFEETDDGAILIGRNDDP